MLRGPQDISSDQALLLGGLLLRPQGWMHRRVEQVSYIDARTIRRRISMDFDVPDNAILRTTHGPIYLPVARFAKRKLSRFDLRDATGQALPMVTAERRPAAT